MWACVSGATRGDANGSASSAPGDARGLWKAEGAEDFALPRVLVEELEAKRESVWRKDERRFWGGWAVASMGSFGSDTLGSASRSLSCRSRISETLRVRVMLWVGAVSNG